MINYPKGWTLTMKQFNDSNSKSFTSVYFSSCHEECMGMRISGARNSSLNLLFDTAYDDNAYRCSNIAKETKISDVWYRIKDSSGYYYVRNKNIYFNKTHAKGGLPTTFGESSDEWSVIEDLTYKICIQGSGNFLTQWSMVEQSENGGVPVLMEHPKIKDAPSSSDLIEFDRIVNTIIGIK